jgi:predicted small lipoprotein YifL
MSGAFRLATLAAALVASVAACGHAAPGRLAFATMPPYRAAPPACFASHGCPGTYATICFAANGLRAASARCPMLRREFRFAEPPSRRR